MTATPTRIITAKMRLSRDAGIGVSGPGCLLGGTGGSSTPTPVIFRGGMPPREEEARGSGSYSRSVNSYGILRMLLPFRDSRPAPRIAHPQSRFLCCKTLTPGTAMFHKEEARCLERIVKLRWRLR